MERCFLCTSFFCLADSYVSDSSKTLVEVSKHKYDIQSTSNVAICHSLRFCRQSQRTGFIGTDIRTGIKEEHLFDHWFWVSLVVLIKRIEAWSKWRILCRCHFDIFVFLKKICFVFCLKFHDVRGILGIGDTSVALLLVGTSSHS